jgi:hypothetical protein
MDQTQSDASDLYLNVKGGENDNGRGSGEKWESEMAKLRKGCKMYCRCLACTPLEIRVAPHGLK